MKMRPIVGAALVVALTVAGCSASSADWTPLPSGADPPAACARPSADGILAIRADQLRFNAPCMAATPGAPFVLRFTDIESEPHNVAIYADRTRAIPYLVGDTVTGPNTIIDYTVDALPAGDYYFECNIHPAMSGALYVR